MLFAQRAGPTALPTVATYSQTKRMMYNPEHNLEKCAQDRALAYVPTTG